MSIDSFPLIDLSESASLERALENLQLLVDGETMESADRAGDGNMNLVMRVVTNRRSFIIKQSRPWVEKFPDIAAPADRMLAELGFYRRVHAVLPLAGRMPRLLGFDEKTRVLAIEDLGEARDYTELYLGRPSPAFPLDETTSWLAELHDLEISTAEAPRIGSQALRELNHEHLFVVPFQSPPAIDLDAVCPGLDQLAEPLQRDACLQHAAERLGQLYLQPLRQRIRPSLLHGDFYPGSWLRTPTGTRLIDPEFCFAGPPEFDLAVLAAHLIFCGGQLTMIDSFCQSYLDRRQVKHVIDLDLLHGWIGIELIRRLLGVAQLPLSADLDQRAQWLTMAQQLVVS